jgi:cystathionine gamma-synthase
MLFPSHITASRCRDFIIRQAAESDTSRVRIVDLVPAAEKARAEEQTIISPKISAVLYPLELFKVAKQFWQHSGDGVSSRRAEYCHHLFEKGLLVDAARLNGVSRTCKGPKRYQKPTSIDLGTPDAVQDGETLTQFVEQRFGRNLDLSMTKNAKLAVRRRIAGSLTADVALTEALSLDKDSTRTRQVADFSEDDVYLYPTGMSSIFNTHRNLLAAKGSHRAIVYG